MRLRRHAATPPRRRRSSVTASTQKKFRIFRFLLLTALEIGVYTPIVMTKHHSPGKSRDDAREAAICTCFNLRKAARAVTQLYDAALGPSGLRATQFSLIAALGVRGAPTISQLAKAMVMDRTTLTRNLKPLE
ncbi:MAG: MarR family transcriptional regulator, partial [Alphaproteobacteria bacterium]